MTDIAITIDITEFITDDDTEQLKELNITKEAMRRIGLKKDSFYRLVKKFEGEK